MRHYVSFTVERAFNETPMSLMAQTVRKPSVDYK